MNSQHGLTEKTVLQITGVLTRFPSVERAVLFGSRAKGTHKRGSDIDLALVGVDLNWRMLGKIDDALEDLLLPYRVGLVIYGKNLDPAVAAHIGRVGVPFFERKPALAEAGK